MRYLSLMLVTASAMAFSVSAYAADEKFESKVKIEKKDDGSYKETSKTSNTDAAGTTMSAERKVDVDVDSDGTMDKTVKTQVVTDPKGLMNKETEKTKDTEKLKADGTVETTHKKTVNGKKVEDTKDSH